MTATLGKQRRYLGRFLLLFIIVFNETVYLTYKNKILQIFFKDTLVDIGWFISWLNYLRTGATRGLLTMGRVIWNRGQVTNLATNLT